MGCTPAQALEAIRGLKAAISDAIATENADDIREALQAAKEHVDALDLKSPADTEATEAWQKVADALDELVAWLNEPPGTAKADLSREDKIKLAVSIAGRGRRGGGGSGMDPTEAIISTFEAGLVGIVKLAWGALKLAVRGLVIAGHLAAAGVVHVAEHYRNGRRVEAYDRDAPSKSMPGAHTLYR